MRMSVPTVGRCAARRHPCAGLIGDSVPGTVVRRHQQRQAIPPAKTAGKKPVTMFCLAITGSPCHGQRHASERAEDNDHERRQAPNRE
jgi:hypothetical protein